MKKIFLLLFCIILTSCNTEQDDFKSKSQNLSGPSVVLADANVGPESSVGRINYSSRQCIGTIVYDFKNAKPGVLSTPSCIPCGSSATFTLPQEGIAHQIDFDECHEDYTGQQVNAVGIAHFTDTVPDSSLFNYPVLSPKNISEDWVFQRYSFAPTLIGFNSGQRVKGVGSVIEPYLPGDELPPSCVANECELFYSVRNSATNNLDPITEQGAPVFLDTGSGDLSLVGVFTGTDQEFSNYNRIVPVAFDSWTQSILNGFVGLVNGPNGESCVAVSTGFYSDYKDQDLPVRDFITAASCVPCSGNNPDWTFTDIFSGSVFKIGVQGEERAECFDNGLAIIMPLDPSSTPFAPAMNVVNYTGYSTQGLYEDYLDPSTTNQQPYSNGYDNLKVTIFSIDSSGNLSVINPSSDVVYDSNTGEFSVSESIDSETGSPWLLTRKGVPIIAGVQLSNGNARTISSSFEEFDSFSVRTRFNEDQINSGSKRARGCYVTGIESVYLNDRSFISYSGFEADFEPVYDPELSGVISYGYLELGTDTRVGHAHSAGDMYLRDRATIDFIGTSYGQYSQQSTNTNVVDFDLWSAFSVSNTDFFIDAIKNSSFPWYQGAPQNVVLEANGPDVTLQPGAYDSITVRSSRKIILNPGDYFFNSLIIDPGADIEINGQYQNVARIHSKSLTLRGNIDALEPDSVAWIYTGSDTLWITPSSWESKIGSVYAVNASAVLANGRQVTGNIVAKSVVLHQDSSVICVDWANTENPYYK